MTEYRPEHYRFQRQHRRETGTLERTPPAFGPPVWLLLALVCGLIFAATAILAALSYAIG